MTTEQRELAAMRNIMAWVILQDFKHYKGGNADAAHCESILRNHGQYVGLEGQELEDFIKKYSIASAFSEE